MSIRKNSLVKVTEDAKKTFDKAFKGKHPLLEKGPFLFFGEIVNMPGHCTVMNYTTYEFISGVHTDNFRELTEDEW